MTPLYTAIATATGARAGHVETSDGKLKADLAYPKEMGGSGNGTNPEQLFACGYGACFGGAMEVVAKGKGVSLGAFTVTPHVTIGKDEGGFGLAVALHVSIPSLDKDAAHAIVEAAHQVCPYSKATRGNIEVTLHVD